MMDIATQTAIEERTAAKWERALTTFDLGWGPDDHERLTITVPRCLYRYSTLSDHRAPHMLRVFVDYDGRTLELTVVISAATTQDDLDLIASAPMHYKNRAPLTLGVHDAREVVAMLMRHYCPRALEIRTI